MRKLKEENNSLKLVGRRMVKREKGLKKCNLVILMETKGITINHLNYPQATQSK